MLVTRALACAQQPNPRYSFEPFAQAVASVPSRDTADLALDEIKLRRQCHEAIASFSWNTLVFALGNQCQKLVDTVAPDTATTPNSARWARIALISALR